ncbi:MAG: DNA polymerase III subunit delta [Candidatus Binataceae bacterium]
MAAEQALGFLRTLTRRRELPPLILIAGPHPFVREYTLDSIVRELRARGFVSRTAQIGGAEGFEKAIEEILAPDLFAAKRVMTCRVLRSHREADDEDGEVKSGSRGASGGKGNALADAIADFRGPNHLVIIYERDNAPAKIRRVAESTGLLIACMRPFDNQLAQYAALFARNAGVKLVAEAADFLTARFSDDLGGIANAIALAAIGHQPGETISAGDFAERSSSRAPELFGLAESLARGDTGVTLIMLDRAMANGRDALEILGVEIVPVLRRMMVAASVLEEGRNATAAAAALKMAPGSNLAARSIEGARRFGAARLSRAHHAACSLDASIKNGLVKETREALAGLIIELGGSPERESAVT